MQFNIDSILVPEKMDTRRMIEEEYIDESFFNITLNYIRESNNEFRECTKAFYKSLLENSQNENVINESFADFFSKIKEIIVRFLKFIKSLFERFITALNGAFKSDKYIKNNKDQIKKFNERNEFRINMFEFTFSINIPIYEAEEAFNKEFLEIASRNIANKDEMLKNISEIYEKFTHGLDRFYDEFRARVIGQQGSIISSDYANALSCVYRNGESVKSEKTITLNDVLESYTRFETYEQYFKLTKTDKAKIEKDYDRIKKQVESMSDRNNDLDYQKFVQTFIDPDFVKGHGISLDTAFISKADMFIKAKTNQVMEMTNIHSLAFATKLDAIKECFIQDKDILYKALYRVKSTPDLEGGK